MAPTTSGGGGFQPQFVRHSVQSIFSSTVTSSQVTENQENIGMSSVINSQGSDHAKNGKAPVIIHIHGGHNKFRFLNDRKSIEFKTYKTKN